TLDKEQEETEAPPAGDVEDKSSEESDDQPFNKNPKFKERIQEIETKYSTKANNWDSFTEMLREDPELTVKVVEKYEAKGLVKPGTADALKKQIASKDEAEAVKPAATGDDEFLRKIEEHPDVKYAKQLREQEERKAKENETQLNGW